MSGSIFHLPWHREELGFCSEVQHRTRRKSSRSEMNIAVTKCSWRTQHTHFKGTLAAALRLLGEVIIWRTFSRAVSPPAARNATLSAVFWRNTKKRTNRNKRNVSIKGTSDSCGFCQCRKPLIHLFIVLDTFEKEHFTAHAQGRGFLERSCNPQVLFFSILYTYPVLAGNTLEYHVFCKDIQL